MWHAYMLLNPRHRSWICPTFWRVLYHKQNTHTAGLNMSRFNQRRRHNSNGIVDVSNVTNGVAWVRMRKRPVNSMDGDFLISLEQAFSRLENDAHCRGAILTSSLPGVFSAGLDVTLLDRKRIQDFEKMWKGLQNIWLRLYSSPLAIVAAINGSAPAAGCMITLACDYRIMAQGEHYIGISAPRLGVMPPPWVQDGLKRIIGHRRAEEAFGKAYMFSSDEALDIGLVDKVVQKECLEQTALEKINTILQVPDHARSLSKQMLRHKEVQNLRDNQEADLEYYKNHVMSNETQEIVEHYLDHLKRGIKSTYIY